MNISSLIVGMIIIKALLTARNVKLYIASANTQGVNT